jgi:hypothetical protein
VVVAGFNPLVAYGMMGPWPSLVKASGLYPENTKVQILLVLRKGNEMIRTEVHALGIVVDILEWDGNEEELREFSPDEIMGEEHGMMMTASVRGIDGGSRRHLRQGDLLIRPAGRADVSPLHLYRDTWWPRALGLIND